MGFSIHERFEVEAPIDRVWEVLQDPRQVVQCLPGAEVTDVIDASSYAGRVRVKVGPVTAIYKGVVKMDNVDESAHLIQIFGEGKERSGGGSAKMSMEGRVTTTDAGGSLVEVDADVDVSGKMARFGRGVMEDVAGQLFKEFASNMQRMLAEAGDVKEADDGATSDADDDRAVDRVDDGADDIRAPDESERPAPSGAVPSEKSVNGLGLLFRAIWARIKRVVRT